MTQDSAQDSTQPRQAATEPQATSPMEDVAAEQPAGDAAEDTAAGEPAGDAATGAPPVASRLDFVPSPVFLAILGLAGAGGLLAWNRIDPGPFLLVLAAWLATVVLHEWAHALVAYRFGASELRAQGRLNLNPMRLPDRFLRVVLPLVYLVVGGFAMTGPAFPTAPHTGRLRRSLVALAGPLLHLVLAAALLASCALLLDGRTTDSWFWSALVYLAYLQLGAAVIALLPVPGLDGYAAIAPYLPAALARLSHRGRVAGPIAVFAVLSFPLVNTVLLDGLQYLSFVVNPRLDLNPLLFGLGKEAFAFWSQ